MPVNRYGQFRILSDGNKIQRCFGIGAGGAAEIRIHAQTSLARIVADRKIKAVATANTNGAEAIAFFIGGQAIGEWLVRHFIVEQGFGAFTEKQIQQAAAIVLRVAGLQAFAIGFKCGLQAGASAFNGRIAAASRLALQRCEGALQLLDLALQIGALARRVVEKEKFLLRGIAT